MNSPTQPLARRTLIKTGLLGAAALPLAACGSQSSLSSSSKKQLSIMLLGPSAPIVKYFNSELLPDFESKHGIKVQLRQSDWGSGFQKLVTGAASGTLADVNMLGGIWTAPLASKHALLPLDDYLSGWSQKNDFYQSMISDGDYEGHSYALPLYADVRTSVYRSDLLNKVGEGDSKLPTTWDGFKSLAGKLAKANGGPLASPVDWGLDKSVGLQQTFAQLMLQAGGTYYGSDGKAQFASDPGLKALNYLVSFYKEKLANVNMVYAGTGANFMVSGKSAQTFTGYAIVQNAKENSPDLVSKLRAGTPLMSEPGGKPTTSAWINKIAISAKTKNRDGAWALMEYLTSKPIAEKLGALFGGLPARKDLAGASYLSKISPGFTSASKYVVPQPPSPNMLQIAQTLNTDLQQAIRLTQSPEQVLAQIDQKVDAINGK